MFRVETFCIRNQFWYYISVLYSPYNKKKSILFVKRIKVTKYGAIVSAKIWTRLENPALPSTRIPGLKYSIVTDGILAKT